MLSFATAGLALVACSRTDPLAERTRQLSTRLDEVQQIAAEAEAQVAHLPEPRRTIERMKVEKAISLNRQGHACADVVNASPLPGTDDSVVTCLEALFGERTVSYRVESATGRATRL